MKPLDCDIDSALDLVIEREKLVKTLPLDGPVQVGFSPNSREIGIEASGMVVRGRLNAGLIHQLGGKIWPNLNLEKTSALWHKAAGRNLPELLERALSDSQSVLRYRESMTGREIYGLTSPNFVEMNQHSFREVLVGAMKPLGISPSGNVFQTPFNEVVEEFGVPGQGRSVGLTSRVIYGLNTGYSSFRIRWGRIVLICSNGLTGFENVAADRWLHSGRVEVGTFAKESVNGAYSHLSMLEKKINAARARAINYSIVDQFLTRLSLVRATKERVSRRLETEFSDTGRNEWSVSQALTFLGSHEKAIPRRVRSHLTRLGTNIIDDGLSVVAASADLNRVARDYDSLLS